jgi:hypothetical protein
LGPVFLCLFLKRSVKSYLGSDKVALPVLILSEMAIGSDKVTDSPFDFVRSDPMFRQNYEFSSRFCLK